jgi:hypothetical protein
MSNLLLTAPLIKVPDFMGCVVRLVWHAFSFGTVKRHRSRHYQNAHCTRNQPSRIGQQRVLACCAHIIYGPTEEALASSAYQTDPSSRCSLQR